MESHRKGALLGVQKGLRGQGAPCIAGAAGVGLRKAPGVRRQAGGARENCGSRFTQDLGLRLRDGLRGCAVGRQWIL
jgi:hypothetical protein